MVQGRGIPWHQADTGSFQKYDSVPETAQVRGGSWTVDPSGEVISVEEHWTKYFDNAVGIFVRRLREASFDSSEMRSAALGLMPGVAGLSFRSPAAGESRLASVLALHEALQRAREAGCDLAQAAAKHLRVTEAQLAELRVPTEELDRIATDPPFADEDALHDAVTGPFFEALLARDQWLIAQPIEVLVQRAIGDLRFQLGDCIVLADELKDGREIATTSTIIWDVPHWLDEPHRLVARGEGRHLRLAFPISPELRVVGEFRGRRSGSDRGACQCLTVGNDIVRQHNDQMRERSRYWVFGSDR